MTDLIAGTDLGAIQREWGDEFPDLEVATDWTMVDHGFERASRWCNHFYKVLRHDTGLTVAIHYASNVADGESASSYADTWNEVEAYEEMVTKYRPLKTARKEEVR